MAIAEIHIDVAQNVGVDDDVPGAKCDASIESFTDDGIVASVQPSKEKCVGCNISAFCEASLVAIPA